MMFEVGDTVWMWGFRRHRMSDEEELVIFSTRILANESVEGVVGEDFLVSNFFDDPAFVPVNREALYVSKNLATAAALDYIADREKSVS